MENRLNAGVCPEHAQYAFRTAACGLSLNERTNVHGHGSYSTHFFVARLRVVMRLNPVGSCPAARLSNNLVADSDSVYGKD